MRRVYAVIVSPANGLYLLYAPSYRVPLVPQEANRGTKAIEAYLRRQGFEVLHITPLRMEDDSIIECFLTNNRRGDSADWKTALEIANHAADHDARVFLAALGWITSRR